VGEAAEDEDGTEGKRLVVGRRLLRIRWGGVGGRMGSKGRAEGVEREVEFLSILSASPTIYRHIPSPIASPTPSLLPSSLPPFLPSSLHLHSKQTHLRTRHPPLQPRFHLRMLASRHQFLHALDAVILCIFRRRKEEAVHDGAPDRDGFGEGVRKVLTAAGGVDEDDSGGMGALVAVRAHRIGW